MGTGAHVTSTGAHPQYERCPPAIITGANTYKYSDGYMRWYRDERIKLAFGTSIAKRRRELGLMA